MQKVMIETKEWVECGICGALVYSDDEVCCVCHNPLKDNKRTPTILISVPHSR